MDSSCLHLTDHQQTFLIFCVPASELGPRDVGQTAPFLSPRLKGYDFTPSVGGSVWRSGGRLPGGKGVPSSQLKKHRQGFSRWNSYAGDFRWGNNVQKKSRQGPFSFLLCLGRKVSFTCVFHLSAEVASLLQGSRSHFQSKKETAISIVTGCERATSAASPTCLPGVLTCWACYSQSSFPFLPGV